jgi:hypothetical protein
MVIDPTILMGAMDIGTPVEKVDNTTNKRQSVRWYHWLKWGDWLIYGLVGTLSAILLLSSPAISGDAASGAVLIRDGETIHRWSLQELEEGGSLAVDAHDYHYQIDYSDGRIRFVSADCPDKVCVTSGWISRPGQIAVCVPGHLMLKINSDATGETDQSEDVDVIIK